MKNELDQFMNEQDIDALWVMGALQNNPDMVYFTGIHHVDNADLFKVADKDPVLYHFVDMEREEAAKTGLQTQSYFSKKPFSAYLKENNNDPIKSIAARTKEALIASGISEGRIAIFGMVNISQKFSLIEQLRTIFPNLEFVSGGKNETIKKAQMTKSPDEIARIRAMGKITAETVAHVQDFLQTQKTLNGKLVFPDGKPVTVKDVKSRIQMWLAELGADNPEGTIFSIGRDGAIPHNSGTPDDEIKLGMPIVFDIYPCETGGGYFYDFTRTWCLGYAPDEVTRLYEQVLEVHHTVIDELQPNQPFRSAQERTCELFSEMGHVTVAQKSNLTAGYLHSIGHGLGLRVHEKPFSGISATPDDVLIPGAVFTIEPGLYYPEKEIGIRIEDTLYLNSDGHFEKLAEYPYDLIIPMKN